MALSNNGRDGKLVDTWHYEYIGIDDPANENAAAAEPGEGEDPIPKKPPVVVPKKVAIELRLHKEYTGDTPPLAVKEVSFSVKCKEADIAITGNDIEALRTAMWAKLDKRFTVQWEQYFLVSVIPHAVYDGVGAAMQVSYQRVERGVAWDGTLLLRSLNRVYMRGEKIEPWPGVFRDKQGKVQACLPATTANQEALEEFIRRVEAMRKRIADFLRPEQIQQTLAGLASVRGLLAAPAAEEE